MQNDDHFIEGRRWLRYAEGDLQAAEAAISQPAFEPRHACFFAQQAAEKALKAILVLLHRNIPRTHDLDALVDALPPDWLLVREHSDLADLTDWAVGARYPDPVQEPTDDDAREAARQARDLYVAVRRDLIAHGFDVDPGQPTVPESET